MKMSRRKNGLYYQICLQTTSRRHETTEVTFLVKKTKARELIKLLKESRREDIQILPNRQSAKRSEGRIVSAAEIQAWRQWRLMRKFFFSKRQTFSMHRKAQLKILIKSSFTKGKKEIGIP